MYRRSEHQSQGPTGLGWPMTGHGSSSFSTEVERGSLTSPGGSMSEGKRSRGGSHGTGLGTAAARSNEVFHVGNNR